MNAQFLSQPHLFIWYVIADTVPGYGINTSCIKAIKSTYSACKGSKTTGKKINEFLEAQLEASQEEVADIFG